MTDEGTSPPKGRFESFQMQLFISIIQTKGFKSRTAKATASEIPPPPKKLKTRQVETSRAGECLGGDNCQEVITEVIR